MTKTRDEIFREILLENGGEFAGRKGGLFEATSMSRVTLFAILDAVYDAAYREGTMHEYNTIDRGVSDTGETSETLGRSIWGAAQDKTREVESDSGAQRVREMQSETPARAAGNWPFVVNYLNLELHYTGDKQWNHNDMEWCGEYSTLKSDGRYTMYLDQKTAHLHEVQTTV